MSKDILQSNWFYHLFADYSASNKSRQTAIETYDLLDKHGFEQIPTGSNWNTWRNQYQMVGYGNDRLSTESLKGFLSAPWLPTSADHFHSLAACAHYLYAARKDYYPETLK